MYRTRISQMMVATLRSARPAPRLRQSGMKENFPARPWTSRTNKIPYDLYRVLFWLLK